jgi:soluble lytic murein transglycosylase-like protein
MRNGFSARTLLLSAIASGLASQALAEGLPRPKPVQTEIVNIEAKTVDLDREIVNLEREIAEVQAEDWFPLPVPRPQRQEVAETEAGSGQVAYSFVGPMHGGDAVVTATTTATPGEADDPDGLRQLVAEQAEINGIPAALANAVVTVESRYNPEAEGSAGEIGLMQIKPDTARLLGFRGPDSALYHPVTNVRWGMKYLAEAQRRSGGTVCGTILKYNAGHGAEAMNPVSKAYCKKVKALLQEEDV